VRGFKTDRSFSTVILYHIRPSQYAPVLTDGVAQGLSHEPRSKPYEALAYYLVVTFDVLDGKIKAIRYVLNPDKLACIGRQ
jgi:hypothetical protein